MNVCVLADLNVTVSDGFPGDVDVVSFPQSTAHSFLTPRGSISTFMSFISHSFVFFFHSSHTDFSALSPFSYFLFFLSILSLSLSHKPPRVELSSFVSVDGDEEDAGIGIKDLLSPVAVMNVEVEDCNALGEGEGEGGRRKEKEGEGRGREKEKILMNTTNTKNRERCK